MIPEKGKKYAIACLGPHDYNQWSGVATYTGKMKGIGADNDLYLYCFEIKDELKSYFAEEDIIAEIADVSQLQAKYNHLIELHNGAMRVWQDKNTVDAELAVLKDRLRGCTIVGADMKHNTITVKLDAPNSIKRITLGEKAKILV
jgi:hypothetical protein